MNSLVRDQFNLLHETQSMRHDLMAILSDDDLRYRLPGHNMTLGELCKAMGEVEYTYIESFKTFKQDFSFRQNEPALTTSTEKLTAWFKALDEQLDTVLGGLSDEDIQNKRIDRGGGFRVPVEVQFHIYREALIIFYGKASLYLRALEKDLPGLFPTWIG
jgi:hypothetical protein